MVKKTDQGLSCVFTPATGDATIYKDGKPVVNGHGLKTESSNFGFAVRAGQDYFGTASIPGVGDPTKSETKFHVFVMNKESMGCSVEDLGINSVPAPRPTAAPAASASAGPSR